MKYLMQMFIKSINNIKTYINLKYSNTNMKYKQNRYSKYYILKTIVKYFFLINRHSKI